MKIRKNSIPTTYLKTLALLLTVWLFPTCNDLEEDLVGEIGEINIPPLYPYTECGGAGGCSNLTSGYGLLRTAGTANHGGYYSLQELTSDEMVITAKGSDWSSGPQIALHQHTYQPTHLFINNTWVQTYQAIDILNEILFFKNSNLDANQEAQARVLRAYFYMRLLDLFGNVKLIIIPFEDGPQVARSELFDFIETEILAALGISEISEDMDLSESLLDTDNAPYQINQFGALGILAKLYLNAEVYSGKKRYKEAELAAAYIIDSGVYYLCGKGCSVTNLGRRNGVASDPDELEGYAAVFAPNNENNPEHIFAVMYDEVTGIGMNFSHMNLHYASQLSYNFTEQPWNGYATLEEFYNGYDDEDIRKEANFLVGEQLDFGGSTVLDYYADDENVVLNYTPQISELLPNAKREAGVRSKKFSYKQFGRTEMDNDFPIVRLGEIYLTRAEALARVSGDWNQAIPDVNILRARAGVSLYTTLDEAEFLAERGREMFQETSRRTDLIRFGQYNGAWWEKPADASNHVNIFPIPAEQIEASNGTLTQNAGY